ncbi:general odorant-binding protein 57c [Coccinella septempunctata]|uniref:general odorant-binding protein 57c n=1 Tax=Coccinella septempunctata TaxID=41139 RepID=UPI001D05E240|nr:general odorant-binding protein 57c [Coccinella septempunctata]
MANVHLINSNLFLTLFLVLFLSYFTWCASFTSEDLDTDMRYIKICNLSSPISMRAMNEVLINKKLAKAESNNFKCFLHCLFMKYGWMDEDGGFLVHDIKKTLEEADIEIASLEYILYRCTALESIDRCERSFTFTECFWRKMSQVQPQEDQLFYSIDNIDKKR